MKDQHGVLHVRPCIDFQGPLDSHSHGSWSVCKVALDIRATAYFNVILSKGLWQLVILGSPT